MLSRQEKDRMREGKGKGLFEYTAFRELKNVELNFPTV